MRLNSFINNIFINGLLISFFFFYYGHSRDVGEGVRGWMREGSLHTFIKMINFTGLVTIASDILQ